MFKKLQYFCLRQNIHTFVCEKQFLQYAVSVYSKGNTGIPCFIMLHFISLFRYYMFYILNFVAILYQASLSVSFFQQHFLNVSVSHFGDTVFFFYFYVKSLLYLLGFSVVSDLQYYYCNCFGMPWATILIKVANLIMCSVRSTDGLFSYLSPSSWASLFPEIW